MDQRIKDALVISRNAEENLARVVTEVYPIGCEVLFTRSAEVGVVRGQVISHQGGMYITIRNVLTHKQYPVNALSDKVRRSRT